MKDRIKAFEQLVLASPDTQVLDQYNHIKVTFAEEVSLRFRAEFPAYDPREYWRVDAWLVFIGTEPIEDLSGHALPSIVDWIEGELDLFMKKHIHLTEHGSGD